MDCIFLFVFGFFCCRAVTEGQCDAINAAKKLVLVGVDCTCRRRLKLLQARFKKDLYHLTMKTGEQSYIKNENILTDKNNALILQGKVKCIKEKIFLNSFIDIRSLFYLNFWFVLYILNYLYTKQYNHQWKLLPESFHFHVSWPLHRQNSDIITQFNHVAHMMEQD